MEILPRSLRRPRGEPAAAAVGLGWSDRMSIAGGRGGGALGRGDPQGGRELPGVGRARAASGRALAGPDQGGRGAGQRRPRAARRGARRAHRRRPPTPWRPASTTTSSRSTSSRPGSGTSSNMNANEVIANLAGDGAHAERPRQHGPELQRRVPVGRARRRRCRRSPSACSPRSTTSATRSQAKAEEFEGHRQDRPHPPDGRRAGHAGPGVRRLRRPDPPGPRPGRRRDAPASARSRSAAPPPGTGLNTHPEFAAAGARAPGGRHRPADLRPRRPVRGAGRPRRPGRGLRRPQGRRRLAHQDRQRHRDPGQRPARRPRRDLPARAAEGLVDHAGQGQPGDPRGRAAGRRPGDRQRHGDHDRRACRATSS